MDNNKDFLKDWLEGKISPDELRSRKEKGDAFVQKFDELISKSAELKVPDTVTKEEAWTKFTSRLAESPGKEARVIRFNRWIPLSIAASLAVAVIAFLLFNNVTVTTQMAETKVYTLPDGSEVTLNADSKITFSRFGWSGERTLAMDGEVFFNVIKGSKFTVESDRGTVTVLGTSFNVNTRASGFEVSCFTGKVKVASGTHEIILTKGLQTKLDKNNALAAAQAFDDKQTTWRTGDFYFEGVPLNMVIDELERQFNVDIAFTGDANRLYTGYFNNQDIDQALDMVFKPMSLNYQYENENKSKIRVW